MNILHIFDCAGVGCILAKYQNIKGHNAHVISYTGMDPFRFLRFYGFECLDTADPTEFYLNAIDRAADYDIIHVHFVWGIIPYLRNKYGGSKKIIMHYHGSEIRQFQDDRTRTKAEDMADAVVCSTEQLLQYSRRAEHIPNPIDTDHFRHRIKDFTMPRKLCILTGEQPGLVRSHISRLGIECDFLDRKKNAISYRTMPAIFSQYTTYVDIKYQDGIPLPDVSKTGYEALASGLEKTDIDGNTVTGLPPEMYPETVSKHHENVYKTVLIK